MIIEMHDPEGTLLEELAMPGITQDSIALTYSFMIRQSKPTASFRAVNNAIAAKWKGKSALERVKTRAWDYASGKASK